MTDQDTRSLGTRVQRRIALGRLFAPLDAAIRTEEHVEPPPTDKPADEPHPKATRSGRDDFDGQG